MIKIFDNKKLFIFILTLISMGFVYGDFVYGLDYDVDNVLSGLRTSAGLSFFSYLSMLGDKYFLIFFSLILSYLLYKYWSKDTFVLKVFWMAFALNMVSGFLIKYFVGRDRPLGAEIYEGYTYSFPSGHSLAAFFVYGFVATFILRMNDLDKKKKYLIAGLSVLTVLAVGFSRLYLGVHFLSDVVGGYLLGWFWLNFLISFFNEVPRDSVSNPVKIGS